MAEHSGLQNLIQRIQSSFKSLVTTGHDSAGLLEFDAVTASLHNENQRFDLWCRNLGAYQSGHGSLEYRLRDAPKIYDYALRLLTDLDYSLALALEEPHGEQDAHQPNSDIVPGGDLSLDDISADESDDDEFLASYNAKSLGDILIESISKAIDRLYRLSFKIRNPVTRFDSSRVLKFKDINSETGTDILTYYAQFDQNHIKELLRDLRIPKPAKQKIVTRHDRLPAEATAQSEAKVANEDSHSTLIPQIRHDELDSDFLVQRLARANNLRRRQFRYWQAHQKKLAAVKAAPFLADVVRLTGNETGPTWHTPSLATTEATKLKEEDVELSDNRSVVSSATYALMQKEPGHEEVRVPPFPEWLEHKNEFVCPYCRIVCSKSMARKSAWETHVLRDLRPYVCTFEDCRQDDQLFDTFQSWRLHEIQAHTAELADPLYGETHESAEPKGQGQALEYQVYQQLLRDTAGDTRTCPLCLLPGVTAAHVGTHLQRIAIFALPLIQHSGKTDRAEDEDSNAALGSANVSSATTASYSGRDSDQSLAQGSSISKDGGETSHLRLDDLIAQEEVDKQDFISRYLDAGAVDDKQAEHMPTKLDASSQIVLVEEADSSAAPLPTSLRCDDDGPVNESVSRLEQVIKIQEQKLPKDHPDRLASQHALAMAYQANGQVREAVALLEQVVKIQEQTLAKDHPSRLASQHALAIAYEANGQVSEAVLLLEQVVKIREQTLAKDHPSRLTSQHALAGAYQANGQVREAVLLLEQVVKIQEQTLAKDHPSRLTSQHALAGAYQANGQVSEAVLLLEQVVKIQEQTLAKDHPSRLTSQHALAGAYQANGQVSEAVLLLEQVVKIQEQTLAKDHPSRLAS